MKSRLVIAVMAGFLALTACEVEPVKGEADDITPTAVETMNKDDRENVYILGTMMRPSFQQLNDQTLLDLGYAICEDLDNGGTTGDAAWTLVRNKASGDDANQMVRMAVNYLCPKHKEDL